jgi:hypothetical protein
MHWHIHKDGSHYYREYCDAGGGRHRRRPCHDLCGHRTASAACR